MFIEILLIYDAKLRYKTLYYYTLHRSNVCVLKQDVTFEGGGEDGLRGQKKQRINKSYPFFTISPFRTFSLCRDRPMESSISSTFIIVDYTS